MDIEQLRALPVGTDLEYQDYEGNWVSCKLATSQTPRDRDLVLLGFIVKEKNLSCWDADCASFDKDAQALRSIKALYGYYSAQPNKLRRPLNALWSASPPSHDPSGLSCSCCLEFYHMAVANRPEGKLVCYSCRSSRPWL